MTTFLYILLAILILLILITVHELGHFIAGKIFGFKINEFAIGFGKAIYKRTNKNGEVFSIRILPLGGFCAFEGEDEDNPHPGAFNNQKPWKRIIVLLSGVLFNFMFGIFMSVIFLLVNGYFIPKIADFAPDCINTTLQKGDIIQKVNGKDIEIYRSLQDMTGKIAAGEEITLTILRDGKIVEEKVKNYKHKAFYYVGKNSGYKLYNESGELVDLNDFNNDVLSFVVGKDSKGKYTDWAPIATYYTNTYIYSVKNETGYELYNAEGEIVSIDEFKKEVSNFIVTKDNNGDYMPWTTENVYYKDAAATQAYTVNELITTAQITLGLKPYTAEELTKMAGISLAKEGTSLGLILSSEHVNYNFFDALLQAWPFAFYICGLILSALGGLFTGATKLSDMGGTITAISQMADISKASFESQSISQFLLLFPLLSMNLALFNALPIPALDGFHCLFVLIEWIIGRPINKTVEGWINTIGLFVLLGLVVFLDIYHFFIACRLLL